MYIIIDDFSTKDNIKDLFQFYGLKLLLRTTKMEVSLKYNKIKIKLFQNQNVYLSFVLLLFVYLYVNY